jgi:hypothetical protein
LIAKHQAVAVLQRLHARQVDIAGHDFDAVLGRAQLLLFRNALGLRPRTFNRIFAKLIRGSGLL